MGLFSKDNGQTFKIIDDNNAELINVAKQKGYTQYQDMSKDGGQTVKTVRADLLKPALDKGYQFLDVINSTASNLDSVKREAQSSGNKFESTLRGFAQMATLGAADELQAGVAALNPFDKRTYTEARDQYRDADDLAWDANPLQYGSGAAVAIAPQIIAAPVIGGMKGLATGAGLGGLSSFGSSERQGADLATDTLIGTGIGAVGGGLGGRQSAQATTRAAGRVTDMPARIAVQSAADSLDDIAQKAAVREVGGESLSRRVADARKTGVQELDKQRTDILQRLDDLTRPGTTAVPVDAREYHRLVQQLSRLDNQIGIHDLGGDLLMKLRPNEYSPRILDKSKELTLQNIEDLKGKNFLQNDTITRDIIDNIVSSSRQAVQPSNNRPVSAGLVGTGLGASLGAGLGAGSTVGLGAGLAGVALATPAGRRLLGKLPGIGAPIRGLDNLVERPNYALAISADKLSEIVRNAPERLGKFANTLSRIADERGPASLRAAHMVLMQNNPEYRKLFLDEGPDTSEN